MDFFKNNSNICISSDKKEIILWKNSVTIDGMLINFPGEYEKSGILTQVREENEKFYFTLQIEGKIVAYIPHVEGEIHDELINFFAKTSILVTLADKANTKLIEVLEPSIIIPFGETKDIFLTTLGQSTLESTGQYKVKDISDEWAAIYVNLSE